jgi:hypothetical protein
MDRMYEHGMISWPVSSSNPPSLLEKSTDVEEGDLDDRSHASPPLSGFFFSTAVAVTSMEEVLRNPLLADFLFVGGT